MAGYKGVNTRTQASGSTEEFYKRTVARLQQIQGQLDRTPRAGRVQDKVCIITGVGSLKGIGCVSLALDRPRCGARCDGRAGRRPRRRRSVER